MGENGQRERGSLGQAEYLVLVVDNEDHDDVDEVVDDVGLEHPPLGLEAVVDEEHVLDGDHDDEEGNLEFDGVVVELDLVARDRDVQPPGQSRQPRHLEDLRRVALRQRDLLVGQLLSEDVEGEAEVRELLDVPDGDAEGVDEHGDDAELEAERLGDHVGEPHDHVGVGEDPEGAHEEGQRVVVVVALAQGAGHRDVLRVRQRDQEDVPEAALEGLGEVDGEGLLVDGLVDQLVDNALGDALGLAHHALLEEEVLPVDLLLRLIVPHVARLALLLHVAVLAHLALGEVAGVTVDLDRLVGAHLLAQKLALLALGALSQVLAEAVVDGLLGEGVAALLLEALLDDRVVHVVLLEVVGVGLGVVVEDVVAVFAGEHLVLVVGVDEDVGVALGGEHVAADLAQLVGLGVLGAVLGHLVEVLDEGVDVDDAVLVALDLLVDVEGLDLGQDLDHRLLEPRLRHQLAVVGRHEALVPDLDALDGLHAVADLVVGLAEELALHLAGDLHVLVLEDEDVAFLLELDQVEALDAGEAAVQVVVEVVDVLVGHAVQLPHLQEAGHGLLERHLVVVVHLHDDNVQEVDDEEHVDRVLVDRPVLHEVAHQREVEDEEDGVPRRDPPVDARVLLRQRVEEALDEQRVERALLHRRLYPDVRHPEEDAVHHDEAFRRRVRESQQRRIHGV
uniref:Uncharacterized protein n=1 Tax=Strombidium rassoulzadegani TaxID=1082188 RepID=A0A7S3CHA6_9SPIT